MPNRIIKESIWDSPNLNRLSDLAERHFYRMLPAPDDFGCFQATTDVVKGRQYPKRTYVTEAEIMVWHLELEEHNLCRFWRVGERLYGVFVNFKEHQRIRALHQRKTPEPPENIMQLNTTIRDMLNLTTSDDKRRQVTASDRLNPNPNPNPNLNPNPEEEKNETSCSRNSKPEFLERVERLKFLILQNNPDTKIKENYQQNWADSVRLMVERDNRSLEKIDFIIAFSQRDDFWKRNILSMGKLREKFDQLWMKAQPKDKHVGIKAWLEEQRRIYGKK